MELLIEGVVLGGVAGAAAAGLLTWAWPLARLGPFGAVVLAAAAGAGAALGLQILGAGALGYATGQIAWRPVVATLGAGASSGGLVCVTIALLRLDARIATPFRIAAERAVQGLRTGVPYVILGVGVAALGALALIRHGAYWIANAPRRLRALRRESEADPPARPTERRQELRPRAPQRDV